MLFIDYVPDFYHSHTVQSSDLLELHFVDFIIKVALNFKSQGIGKIKLFSQRSITFKICDMKLSTDYEYADISSLLMLDIKLWLKEASIS